MDDLVRERRPLRVLFNEYEEKIKELLAAEMVDLPTVEVTFGILVDTFEKLSVVDQKFVEFMRQNPVDADAELREYRGQGEFKIKLELLRKKVEILINRQRSSLASTDPLNDTASHFGTHAPLRNYTLPQVKIPTFDGELKNWQGYWAKFEPIHEDKFMSGSDKFTYLLQTLEIGSEPYKIVTRFPQNAANYMLAVEALKKNYADPDILLEVYIRELLGLIVSNVTSKEKLPLKDMFLSLDSQIRSLRTLNIVQADPSIWLFPLVEACLPSNVLKQWKRQRNGNEDDNDGGPKKNRIDSLLDFMEKEVALQNDVDRAEKFSTATCSKSSVQPVKRKFHPNNRPAIPTMAGFHVSETKHADSSCLFCGKGYHKSWKCFRAKKMDIATKKSILAKNSKCFYCFGSHHSRNCNSQIKCPRCDGRHYFVMCEATGYKKNDQMQVKRPRVETEEIPRTLSSSNHVCSSDVVLQTLKIKIGHVDRMKTVRVFVDPGSQRSYVLKRTARELAMEPATMERVVHSLFGGHMSHPTNHQIFEVEMKSLDGGFSRKFRVRDQREICGKMPNAVKSHRSVEEELIKLNLNLTDQAGEETPVELLIGADIYSKILTGKIIELDCGLTAIETKFGWTLMGEVEQETNTVSIYHGMMVSDATITQLWDLDKLGIENPEERHGTEEMERIVKEKFVKMMKQNADGRFNVRLPWKDGHPTLPSNREIALKRLRSTVEKLKKIGMLQEYEKIFNDWEKEGFIEKVNEFQFRCHYVPHRPVIKRESETTPVRPVFDASCKTARHVSLNDCLEKGPNLIQLIPSVLNRFRMKKVAFVSDIRKAFQMIEIDKQDQDSMRFLWCKDGDLNQLIEYKHTRVMFGATSSPFILGAVLENYLLNLPEEKRELGAELWKSFYVDNCVASVDCQADYLDFRKMAVDLLKDIKMDLRMWYSNVDGNAIENPIIPVLGLLWNRAADTLTLKLDKLSIPAQITKRSILSSIAKIFDPIGFSAPALIPMKVVLQRTWIEKLGWNDQLPEEEEKLFTKWIEEIQCLKDIQIPRLATGGERDSDRWSMHMFADASATAFAAVAFIRVETDTEVYLNLISAKARVSPIKKLTIPRLELLSCLLAARLSHAVRKSLGLDKLQETFWSDSTTALAWIKRMEPWATWVGNRVQEIRQLTRIDQWRHVPGVYNPADLPSRGCSPKELLKSKWWQGPDWLKLDESQWPSSSSATNEDDVFLERRKTEIPTALIGMTNLDMFQNFYKEYNTNSQIRILAWTGRFLFNARAQISDRRRGELSPEEIQQGERYKWKLIQDEYFSGKGDTLKGLEVLEDKEGILRVKTRLTLRDDLHDFKFPILLHGKSPFVRKMIMEVHRENHHAGVGFVMTKIREKFWILHARKSIRSVISTCVRCRRFSAKAFTTPTAPLPIERIRDAEVFQTVGVDLAGPLFLKNGNKVWLVIFTCAVYRAVYFTAVASLSTTAFIGAMKKFIDKYRRPEVLYCDNGTNFHGAANMFRKLDWKAIQQNEDIKPIVFKFSPPISAWYGGWWERLIGVAKDLLKRSVGKRTLNRSELDVVIREITDIINQRPLTYVSEDPNDLEPLTPSHFINPLGKTLFPEADLSTAEKLRMRLNVLRKLKEELQGRFRKEYLAYLISRNPKKESRGLRIGEMVIVGDDNRKRIMWPLAKVLDIFPGKDGIGRVAKLQTAEGILTRTVQRLYPLELNSEVENTREELEKVYRTRAGRLTKKPGKYGAN